MLGTCGSEQCPRRENFVTGYRSKSTGYRNKGLVCCFRAEAKGVRTEAKVSGPRAVLGGVRNGSLRN